MISGMPTIWCYRIGPSACAVSRLLGKCERYVVAHGLKYNTTKSEVLVFQSRGFKVDRVPNIVLNGVPL